MIITISNKKIQINCEIWHKYAFFSSVIFGVLANLYMLTNKISFHDDIGCLFTVGATYSSGRWFLGVLGKIVSMLFGNYSLPVLEGLLTIFFIALSSVFVIDIFNVKDKLSCCLIGAIMSVFPTVFATFAYMFTAPYYYFALLLSVLSVYVVQQHKFGFLPAICLIACSTGIYQAFFPVSVSLFLGLLITNAIQTEMKVPSIIIGGGVI
ncbi:MAG: glucosyltransferase domain-containing protein [Clostridium sp.]|nr:glucosyltransferase domain-containing protein [Clostridium sp.]